MKRVIRFTRVRVLMLTMSALVIAATLSTTVFVHHGFNLGIDFTGGANKQFQVLPVAFTVRWTGEGEARLNISGSALTLSIAGTAEPRELSFPFKNYGQASELLTALGFIEGLVVEPKGSTDYPTELIQPLNFPTTLSDQPFAVNRGLAQGEPIFAPIAQVRAALVDFERFSLQVIGNPRDQRFVIKVFIPPAQDNDTFLRQVDERIVNDLSAAFGQNTVILERTDFVSEIFTEDLIRGAIWAVVVALVLILVYITVRFRFAYAAAAVVALIHDVSVMIGVIGAFQLEVTSTTIAAVLTIIGYSLNDTIVVFDRVRENFSLMPEADRETVINTSITQSLSRTIITSLTTLLAVVAITIFATGAIRDFSLNLIIGIVVGTYSSIYVASPMVLGWQNAVERRRRRRQGLPVAGRGAGGSSDVRPAASRSAAEQQSSQGEAPEVREQNAGQSEPTTVTRTQPVSRKRKRKKKKR